MKTPKTLLIAGAISVFSISLAVGQQPEEFQAHKASELEGSRVVNNEGDRLGTVDDLVLEIEDGVFSYAIIAAGGLRGVGVDWRPVPPSALQRREAATGTEVLLDISSDQWDQAPVVDRDQIEQLTQESRGQQIYQFYGEDWQAHQQRQTEFAVPPRERAGQEQQSAAQAQQIEQQLQQAMTQAGAVQRKAQEEAQRLARQLAREKPERQQIERQVEQAMIQAGASQRQTRLQSQRLAQQIEQQLQQEQRGIAQQAGQQQKKVRLATDLRNTEIVNQQEEEVGKITDFLVSSDQGRIAFVLFSEETGPVQTGDEEYAIAPYSFEQIQEDQVTLNITQRELQQAQALTPQQLQARELARMDPQQAHQQPQVFRYQDATGATGVFGAPEDRSPQDRGEDQEE